jgi:hypothetical protein
VTSLGYKPYAVRWRQVEPRAPLHFERQIPWIEVAHCVGAILRGSVTICDELLTKRRLTDFLLPALRVDQGKKLPGKTIVPPGPFVIGGTDGDAGLAGSKSTPETLTTACHAASWLARSCKCG